eukprot:NODE_2973_length_837_cov_9.426396_g2468_i0.p2 GENE.NODE_2973_length_837_cov_9.426396_g2468_i0~~NODE_2973_length_837_cov_9.426396_g2468_i0.p2  ORF type:complete len:103 (-),score=5.28 NODE_2973_length_837_cov_9.426396_g2468_i0:402-710(-)
MSVVTFLAFAPYEWMQSGEATAVLGVVPLAAALCSLVQAHVRDAAAEAFMSQKGLYPSCIPHDANIPSLPPSSPAKVVEKEVIGIVGPRSSQTGCGDLLPYP